MLRLYDIDAAPPIAALLDDPALDARVHACSRFRSVLEPDRRALYSVHDADRGALLPLGPPLGGGGGEHTLMAVREFRRVPLDASSLALTLFTARPGQAVPVVAALAHFVERAVDLYQPGYLLLAHSLEEPGISMLLTAVRESAALATGSAAAFSLDELRAELDSLLDAPPESYAYCPAHEAASLSGAVSPYAV